MAKRKMFREGTDETPEKRVFAPSEESPLSSIKKEMHEFFWKAVDVDVIIKALEDTQGKETAKDNAERDEAFAKLAMRLATESDGNGWRKVRGKWFERQFLKVAMSHTWHEGVDQKQANLFAHECATRLGELHRRTGMEIDKSKEKERESAFLLAKSVLVQSLKFAAPKLKDPKEARSIDHPPLASRSAYELGMVEHSQEKFDEALKWFAESARFADAGKIPRDAAIARGQVNKTMLDAKKDPVACAEKMKANQAEFEALVAADDKDEHLKVWVLNTMYHQGLAAAKMKDADTLRRQKDLLSERVKKYDKTEEKDWIVAMNELEAKLAELETK